MAKFRLISFKLCPFVQRSVIVLKEKKIPFEIDYIDLKLTVWVVLASSVARTQIKILFEINRILS